MKVMFDITVLGIGHVTEKARTGVFRVIENVAGQLLKHPGCDVTFCSNYDRENLGYAIDYWKATQTMSSVRFSIPPFFDFCSRITNSKNNFIQQIVNQPTMPLGEKTAKRIQIKRFQVLEWLYRSYYKNLLDPADAKGIEIYHSPFFAPPSPVFTGAYKSVFITCYDLIPVLFPEYFEQHTLDMMNDLLCSVTQETWVLCISESTRNDLLNHMGNRLDPQRVVVTPLAASETFYQSLDKEKNLAVRKKHNIPNSPYILSLCTFEPRKNIVQVIKSFAQLLAQESIPDLYLVLVGNKGWLFDKIFDEIENSVHIKDRIIITGFVADEDLASIYSDALLFVYPSFYEGFGLPPLEAMKCGIPVITSNTSSLPEVVGNAGIMVSPTNLDELSHAMLSVYKSPALQQQMTVKSLEQANLFSWQRCADQTVDAYRNSLQ